MDNRRTKPDRPAGPRDLQWLFRGLPSNGHRRRKKQGKKRPTGPGKQAGKLHSRMTANGMHDTGENLSIMQFVLGRPTITDVARLCGVPPATVSRVLNGKKKFSTSESTREKILATAQKLGYVPDLAARNLNRRSTHIIGLF